MSAFADADIIKMCQNDFIAVTGDDWYQRRRKDREGEFFRKLAADSGKKGHTLQGIYLFAADGTPLDYRNCGFSADITKEMMRQALRKFGRLPKEQREPKIEAAGEPDPNYSRIPPEGGLILKTYTRILDIKSGEYTQGKCETIGGDKAARDHLWISKEEARALVPAKAEVGFRYPLPAAIANRLARFHLVDNTRGEPDFWKPDEVRAKRFSLVVAAVSQDALDIRLEGEAVLTTDANTAKAERGYEVRLVGSLRYLPKKAAFDRFDITAVGSHWGDQTWARAARPGKSLLGVSFELAGETPADRVPPQAIRNRDEYWGK